MVGSDVKRVITPVVFLVFNRPDVTRLVFERIRTARPQRLLVVSDGPRIDRPDDRALVNEVRSIIDSGVDWPCEVSRKYSEQNLGCREGVASGINWVFSLVEEAIFLEDDCLPDPSFFGYCETMLERYRDEQRVMHINGTNFIADFVRDDCSYFFSKYVWVWGWASWRRAWKHYDYSMATWDERKAALAESFDSGREQAFWSSTFEEALRDWRAAATWDFPWMYSCWTRGALTVVPSVNLVENCGFGPAATHTTDASSHLRRFAGELKEIHHPTKLRRSRLRDDLMFRAYAGESLSCVNNFSGALRVVRHLLRCYWANTVA